MNSSEPSVGDDPAGEESRRRRLVTLLVAAPAAGAAGGVASGAGRGGDGVGDPPPDRLRARLGRVCEVSVTELGVSGAGVTVMGSMETGLAGHRDQPWATGELTRRLEDLQLTAGEGPCLDAYRNGMPVLAADVAAEPSRWLGFGPEAIAAGAAALFSLPLQVGAVRLGTLDLCRATVGALSREQLADALMLAGLATEILLELAQNPDPSHDGPPQQQRSVGWLPDVHADVHVASGMISARAGFDVRTALLRIRGYAFAHGEPIHGVARRIIDRDLVLEDPGPDDPDDGRPGPDAERER